MTTQVRVEQRPQVALREVFPPSSSPSLCSPASSRRIDDGDDDDDDDLARENETIDRLLLEANADLVRLDKSCNLDRAPLFVAEII